MPDPTTINLALAIPTHGSDVDAWDVPVNGNSSILDNAFGGVASTALTNVPVSLSAANAQKSVLRFSGILTGNVTVTLPAIVKFWTVQNNCTGAFVVTLTTGSGKVLGLPPGNPIDIFSDGTDLYFKNLEQVGSYIDVGSAAVPAWIAACTVPPYLNCDGTAFSAVTYPALNALLGTTTLPDLRGRNRSALNQGTGRITTAVSGIDGNTIFSVGGEQGHTLTQSELSVALGAATSTVDEHGGHLHNLFAGGGGVSPAGIAGSAAAGATSGTAAGTTATATTGITVATTITNAAGGNAHNNMPPTQISGITLIRAA